MNSLTAFTNKFYRYLAAEKNAETVIKLYYKIINEMFPEISSAVVKNNIFDQTFEIVSGESEFSRQVVRRLTEVSKSRSDQNESADEYLNKKIVPLTERDGGIRHFICYDKIKADQEQALTGIIDFCRQHYAFYKRMKKTLTDDFSRTYANLVSQVIHDFNSLIVLVDSQLKHDDLLSAKLNYSKKLTQETLFYIRDLVLLKSDIAVKELINSSLAKMGDVVANGIVKTRLQDITIRVDVELFDRAFSEIVLNSLKAISKAGSGIEISSAITNPLAPFSQDKWLELIVIDDGDGIADDFLALVKDPYFTTFKSEGHCGLGLSIADKIIAEHGGCLTVNNMKTGGVRAGILLPLT